MYKREVAQMVKLKTVKISTGVDKHVMGNISRFITHSGKALKTGLAVSSGRTKKSRKR